MAKTTSKSSSKSKTTAKATKPKSSAKKATTAKKTAAKKATAKVAAEDTRKRLNRDKIVPQIVKMRDTKNMSWGDIGAELDINAGTVRHLYMIETTDVDLTWETEEELYAHIVEQRKALVSWPNIGIRTGTSQPKVKAVFAKHSGKDPNQGWVVSRKRAELRAKEVKADKKAKAVKVTNSRAKKAKSGN